MSAGMRIGDIHRVALVLEIEAVGLAEPCLCGDDACLRYPVMLFRSAGYSVEPEDVNWLITGTPYGRALLREARALLFEAWAEQRRQERALYIGWAQSPEPTLAS